MNAVPLRSRATFEPTLVTELELARSIPDLEMGTTPDGRPYLRTRVLIRLHGQPLGFVLVEAPDGSVPAKVLLETIRGALGPDISSHLADDGASGDEPTVKGVPDISSPRCLAPGPHGDPAPSASVIVCTRERHDLLSRALRSILDLDYRRFEVLVVDSAPLTPATRELVEAHEDDRIRYVLEPRPGLSRARNRGLREASGELFAFTDDDVVVDRSWLSSLARGFTRAPRVGCVTSLVPSAQLDTPAQAYFDQKVQWSLSVERRLYDLERHRSDDPLYPYISGTFGTGASFAVSRSTVKAVGEFDEALGAGSPSRGGEDLDYFLRTVRSEFAVAYEPGAIAWHTHRRDEASLRSQLYGYGSGLSAYASKQLLSRSTAWDVARRLPRALRRAGSTTLPRGSRSALPRGIWISEARGFLQGPLNYALGRVRVRAGREAGT